MASGNKRRWPSRRATVCGTVLLLAGAGAGVGISELFLSGTSGATASPITSTTSVQKVTTGTITQTVASSGTVVPENTADLDFGASGRVTSVKVAAGDTVAAGQALATIDGTALAASLTLAQATLASDQAQLATDDDAGASSATLASDQATIANDQTSVTRAQDALSDATLTSTIAGTVSALNLTVGQEVSGSGSSSPSSSSSATSPSTSSDASSSSSSTSAASDSSSSSDSSSGTSSAQVEVVSTGSYDVSCDVSSADITSVAVGDQVTLTGTGASGNVFGTVASVGKVATVSSNVAAFPVVVDVTGSPTGLYAGTTATVSIVTKELQDVVVVPTGALHYSRSQTTVLVDDGGKKVSRPVVTGDASGGNTQVVSGLTAGEKVYVTEITFRPGGSTATRTGSGLFGGSGGFSGGGGGFSRGGGGGFSGGGGGFTGGGFTGGSGQ